MGNCTVGCDVDLLGVVNCMDGCYVDLCGVCNCMGRCDVDLCGVGDRVVVIGSLWSA
jgi:hypothetical protein